MYRALTVWRAAISDTRGSIAVLFAASLFVIILSVGIAIDGARAYNVSTRVSAALDAAALAAAKMLDDPDMSNTEIEERARHFFDAGFETTPVLGVHAAPLEIRIDRSRGEIEVSTEIGVTNTFGQIAGLNEFRFPRSARVRYNQKFLEMAMVVDITGSMCSPCDKIEGLKTAARELVSVLINPTTPYGYARISLVPYSAAVNAGPYAATVSGGMSIDGCVVERSGSNNATDSAPSGGGTLGVSSGAENPNYSCPAPAIMPLTADRATLESKIDTLTVNGGTAGHIGLAWGWYTLTHRWNTIWTGAERPRMPASNLVKAVLLMTDGEFNTSYLPGAAMNATDVAVPNSSPEQAQRLCNAMKADGIVVYTVAFQSPPTAETLLRGCASSAAHYYPASSTSDLISAFRSIAERLAALRLSS